jgi:hypothetical protein
MNITFSIASFKKKNHSLLHLRKKTFIASFKKKKSVGGERPPHNIALRRAQTRAWLRKVRKVVSFLQIEGPPPVAQILTCALSPP